MFESKWFVPSIIGIGIVLLICAILFLPCFGVEKKDIALLVATTVLTVIVTLIAITIPIRHDIISRRNEKEEEMKQIYINSVMFIGSELANNVELLQRVKDTMGKNEKVAPSKGLLYELAGVEVAGRALQCLDDRSYGDIIASGILVKAQDSEFINRLQMTYQDIRHCKVRFGEWAEISHMTLNPPPPIKIEDSINMHRDEVEKVVRISKEERDNTIKSIEECIKAGNKVIKQYGKEFTIQMTTQDGKEIEREIK
ncbi:MAG: hypothetical protein A2W23_00920 [Planctomycetes bacterium RBG_16_43_13]|nr:MAG: hypothetical protein A2W23_00920 [Planctomycetes bacterium RBG_16_43_13]